MRHAAFDHPTYSAKLTRLKEIVNEAGANGHKIIVFPSSETLLTRSDLHSATPTAGSLAPMP